MSIPRSVSILNFLLRTPAITVTLDDVRKYKKKEFGTRTIPVTRIPTNNKESATIATTHIPTPNSFTFGNILNGPPSQIHKHILTLRISKSEQFNETVGRFNLSLHNDDDDDDDDDDNDDDGVRGGFVIIIK